MTNDEFSKMWKKFLIDIGMSETDVSKECGENQQSFNGKFKKATIKYVELSKIVEKYGYTIDIRKKDN